MTTVQAVERLCAAIGCDPREAGWAGLKDRHAVTTQWVSLFGASADAARGARVEGVEVLEAVPHDRRLKTAHLRGNRFAIRLRRVSDPAAVQAALATLGAVGVPNYFGEQRFGRDGDNAERARRWLVSGGRAPRKRFERKLLVSALQSEVFNEVLAARIRDGLLGDVVDGDLLRKEDTGGVFVADDLPTDRARAARFEVSATGPMVGPRMRWPLRQARDRELAALAAAGLDEGHLERFGRIGRGTRRALRIRLQAPEIDIDRDTVDVRFTLTRGAYATTVLRELATPPPGE